MGPEVVVHRKCKTENSFPLGPHQALTSRGVTDALEPLVVLYTSSGAVAIRVTSSASVADDFMGRHDMLSLGGRA